MIAAFIQWGDEFNPGPWGVATLLTEPETHSPVELKFLAQDGHEVPLEDVVSLPGPASRIRW